MKADVPPVTTVPMAAAPPVYGLVLIGGQSTRMGQDKSSLSYHGKPQRDHLTELLAPLCETVYWSVNETQYGALTYSQMLLDTYPETGPMGGLLTAFGTYPTVAWLIVPCDLPQLDTGTLQTLLAGRNSNRVATAFWDAERTGPEPLVSLWEPSAGSLLPNWFESGNRSPRRFLATHPVTLLDVPNPHVFENVNDWQGYLRSKQWQ